MKRLYRASAALILSLLSWSAWGACPTGSTCETFPVFSHIIKLVATGDAPTDTANFKAALMLCGPNISISFTGIMQISPPGLGDPPAGCEITGFDTDPYEGGTGFSGASLLQASGTSGWPAGSAIIGSNDGVTLAHFTIDGNFSNTGNCVNVHNVQGFTALYVHVYQCLPNGWNVLSDGNDTSHSHNFSKDIQIWNSANMRNAGAGIQVQAINGGSNTDVQVLNNTYSQNGNSPSNACTLTEPGNVVVLAGTAGFITMGSRNEDSFCTGNRAWDIENATRVTLFGLQSDMLNSVSLYLNNTSNIAIAGTEETNSNLVDPRSVNNFTGFGPYVQLGGTINRFISFGNRWDLYESAGCVYTAAGSTVTNAALYEAPYGAGAFCDTATGTILTPFFVSNDRAFP
jgi:hypothetical protein